MEKAMKERNGLELKQRARDRRLDEPTRQAAITELERRRGNLRGACIPEWERAARGPKVDEWAVV